MKKHPAVGFRFTVLRAGQTETNAFYKKNLENTEETHNLSFLSSQRLKGKTTGGVYKSTSATGNPKQATQRDSSAIFGKTAKLVFQEKMRQAHANDAETHTQRRFSRPVSASSEMRALLWGVIIIEIKALMMTIDDGIHTQAW